jgi:transposase-like protein
MSRSKSPRVFNREFKLGIIRRLLAGENVSALGRPAGVLPSWSARSASSRSNSIFFGKPCGRSTIHASRTPGLA